MPKKVYKSKPSNANVRARAIATVAKAAYNAYRSYNKSGQTKTDVVTSQNDIRTLYRKKPVSRKKVLYARKKWRIFRRNLMKTIKPITQQTNSYITSSSLAGQQNYVFIPLNSYHGTNPNSDHLLRVMNQIYNATFQPVSATANVQNVNIQAELVRSVLDCTVTNTSSVNAEIDMYHMVCTSDVDENDYADFVTMIQNRTGLIGAPQITINTLGTSPFDLAGHGRYWKVLKIQRAYITAGQALSFDLKSGVRTINYEHISSAGGVFARKGLTRGILFIYRGVPSATSAAPITSLAFSNNFHYTMKVHAESEAKDALI